VTDVPAASVHAYDRETTHYQSLINEAESIEIEAKERRSYSCEAGEALIFMLTIPGVIVFLGACAWAIATNG